MTARESVREKARRMLADGRLRIREVGGGKALAEIDGDTGTYLLGYHPRVKGGWWCKCPYRSGEIPGRPGEYATCSHILALMAVIDVERLKADQLQLVPA